MDAKERIKNFTESKEFKAVKTIAEMFDMNLVYSEDMEGHKKINNHRIECRIDATRATTGKKIFSSEFTNEAAEIDEKLLIANIMAGMCYCNPYLCETQVFQQLMEDIKKQLLAEEVKERAKRRYEKRE